MKKHRTAAQMRAVLEDQASSGLSKKSYCEQAGIDQAVFYYWQRRLANKEVDLSTGFTALELRSFYELEVDLGGGHWVGLRSESIQTLKALVKSFADA